MKRNIPVLLMILITTILTAEENTAAGTNLTPGDAAAYTAISAGLNFAYTFEPLFADKLFQDEENRDNAFFLLRAATQLGAHAPLYALNPGKALAFTGVEAAGLSLLTVAVYPLNHNWFIAGPASLITHQLGGMLATYETYREARRSVAGHYSEDWVDYDWYEILASQFAWDTLRQPIVWIPAALALTAGIFTTPDENAVWKSGEAWLGDWRMSAAAGSALFGLSNLVNYSMVGIGEEAMYRGVIYEELTRAVGKNLAKVIDAGLIFPLIHVPQYVYAGNSLPQILLMTGYISAATIIFDFAYDIGGLPLSAATHMWLDFFYYTAMGLQVIGKPMNADAGNNQTGIAEVRLTGITVSNKGLTLKFGN